MQLIMMGTFFVLPVYLQVVLGFDAFETGKRLFPMSVTMLAAALLGPKLRAVPAAGDRPARPAGDGGRGLGDRGHDRRELKGPAFALSLALFGVGAGLLALAARERDHVFGRPDQVERDGRPSGNGAEPRSVARHRAHRLDPAAGLLNGFNARIQQNPAVSADVKTQIAAATENGIPIVTTEQAHQALLDAGATPAEADAVTADYGTAQLDALKTSMLAVAFLAVISFWFTRRLPGKPRKTA